MLEVEEPCLPRDIWSLYLDFENFYFRETSSFPDFLCSWDDKLKRLTTCGFGLTYSDTLLGFKLLERCTLEPAESINLIISPEAAKAIKSESFLRYLKNELLKKYLSVDYRGKSAVDQDFMKQIIKVENGDLLSGENTTFDVDVSAPNAGPSNRGDDGERSGKGLSSEEKGSTDSALKNDGQNQYSCALCPKTFVRKTQLTEHLLTHDAVNPDNLDLQGEVHTCQVCNKKFGSLARLKKHCTVHSDDRPFSCDQCPKTFKRSEHLKEHKVSHSNIREFQCGLCQRRFNHSKDLKKHELRHTGDKPFVCDLCGKAFVRLAELNIHRRTHEPDDRKPFQCEICHKGFVLTHDFERHKMTHTGEKPFTCQVCGKGFIRNSILTKHIRLHEENRPAVNKPHHCNQCTRSFRNKTELTSHQRFHTRENLFKCDVCHKEFVLKVCLKRHMKIHTNKGQYSTIDNSKLIQPSAEELVQLNPAILDIMKQT